MTLAQAHKAFDLFPEWVFDEGYFGETGVDTWDAKGFTAIWYEGDESVEIYKIYPDGADLPELHTKSRLKLIRHLETIKP
jgi:hypothetical protein